MKEIVDAGTLFAALEGPFKDPAWDEVSGPGEKQSAVLVPFFFAGGEISILVVERSVCLRRHPGQIAFPGGVREPADMGPVHTALREFEEETGISSGTVDIISLLPKEHAFSSDFTLYPVAGFVKGRLDLKELSPDPVEVRRLIEIPLKELMLPPLMEDFFRNGERFQYPVYIIGGDVRIWGATAWIIQRMTLKLQGLFRRLPCP